MAKKAELELDCQQYYAIMDDAHAAQKERRHQAAVTLAVEALQYVDGMMQFERKYRERTEHLEIAGIEVILRYAPLMFDLESLDALAIQLKSQRRIDKNTTADIAADLAAARALMWDAFRLWNHIENTEVARQDELRLNLGGDQDQWRSIAETWDEMGLITRIADRNSYILKFTSPMDAKTRGKCPSCGVTGTAAKAKLLEGMICPKCKSQVHFVLLTT